MNSPKHICRLCLHEFTGPPNYLRDDVKLSWMLRGVLTGLDVHVTETPKICPECFKYVKFAYHIKGTVISNEHKIIDNIKLARRIQENTCRLCFKMDVKRSIALYNCDQPLPFTEIRNIIEVAIAEINFHLYKKPVICNNCWQIVRAIYLFKKRCWMVEKLLKYYCINNKVEVLREEEVIDISKCYMSQVKKYFENNRVFEAIKEKIVLFRQKTRHVDLLQIEKRIFEGPSLIRFFKNGASFIDKLIKPIDQSNFSGGGICVNETTIRNHPSSLVKSQPSRNLQPTYSDRTDDNFIFPHHLPEIKEEVFEEICESEEGSEESQTKDVIDINDLILEFSNSPLDSDDEFTMDFASFNSEHYAYIQDLQDFLDKIWPKENSICVDDIDSPLPHHSRDTNSQLRETVQFSFTDSTNHKIIPKNSKTRDHMTPNKSNLTCPLLETTLFNLENYGEVSIFQRKSNGANSRDNLSRPNTAFDNSALQSSKKSNRNLKLLNSVKRNSINQTDIDRQENIKDNTEKLTPATADTKKQQIKNDNKQENAKIFATRCMESTEKADIENDQKPIRVTTDQPTKCVKLQLAPPPIATIIPKCNDEPLNENVNLEVTKAVTLKSDDKKPTTDTPVKENKNNAECQLHAEQIDRQTTRSKHDTKDEDDRVASNINNGQVNITNVITINRSSRKNFSGATVTMNIEFSEEKGAETVGKQVDPGAETVGKQVDPLENKDKCGVTDESNIRQQFKCDPTNIERILEQSEQREESIDKMKYDECNKEGMARSKRKIAPTKTNSLKTNSINRTKGPNNNQGADGWWHCSVCAFKTKYKQHLTRHMQLHDDDAKSLDCPKCLYSTKIKRNFIRHMAVHTSNKALQCPGCDFNAADRTALKNHNCSNDKGRSSAVKRENCKTEKIGLGFEYNCPECPYVTARQEQYVAHCRAHRSTEKVYKCDKCYYITTRSHSIKDHMQLHDEPKGKTYRYKCEYCSLTCKKRTHLVSHMLVHGGSYKFECSECDYKAKRKSHLVTHMLQHQRPEKVFKFQCLHCPYKAKRKEHLRIHSRNVHCTKQAVSLNSNAVSKEEETCWDIGMLESNMFTKKTIQCPLCSYQIKCNWSLWIKHLSEVHYPSRTEYFECAECSHKSMSRRHFIQHLKLHRN